MWFLTFASFIPVGVLALVVWHPFECTIVRGILFNRRVNRGIFLAALVCLLVKFSTLGDADFGGHRRIFQIFLAFLAVGALWRNYGFLAVRGIVILQLLWACAVLNALLDNYQWWALGIKIFVYGIVLESLYLAVCSYRLRDWWMRAGAQNTRPR
ncbi:MAG: hypothetical protein LBD33_03165 [Puniceicoccales bacterium]|jgi:hypothetical protein|nr:hypothetical protein [Puniceicoccales bacterium]